MGMEKRGVIGVDTPPETPPSADVKKASPLVPADEKAVADERAEHLTRRLAEAARTPHP